MTARISSPSEQILFEQAVKLLGQYDTIPNAHELYLLTQGHGIDLATACYDQAVRRSAAHGERIRQIDSMAAALQPARRPLEVLIVPALFYRERPEFGGDGRLIAELARAAGHTVTVAPLQSRGSMAENAELIWQQIRQPGTRPRWIVSLSKGGGEVRLAWQTRPHDPAWASIRGWINIGGLVRGTPLAQRYGWGMRAFFLLAGVAATVASELDPAHLAWQQPWAAPPWPVLNVIGIPLRRHLQQRNMRWRYDRLARNGPNDGMAPLHDLLIEPGWIYPVWGCDHFFQTPQVRSSFTRILAYLDGLSVERDG